MSSPMAWRRAARNSLTQNQAILATDGSNNHQIRKQTYVSFVMGLRCLVGFPVIFGTVGAGAFVQAIR